MTLRLAPALVALALVAGCGDLSRQAPLDQASAEPAPPVAVQTTPATLVDFSPKKAKGPWASSEWRQHHALCRTTSPLPALSDSFSRSRWLETCGYVSPPTSITILGSGFAQPAARNSVFLGGVKAEVLSGDATQLVVRPKGGPPLAVISVRTSGAEHDDPAAPDRSTLPMPIRLLGLPRRLEVVEGAARQAPVGSALGAVVVRLTDGANEPVPDERVWFSFVYARGRESSPVSETLTDALGLARVEITLPAAAGRLTVTATAVNVSPEVSDEPRVQIEATALPTPSDLDALLAGLRSTDHTSRYHAAQALGDLGPLALSTVPALRTLAGSSDPGTRQQALNALARIDPQSALPLVVPGLRGEQIGTRIDAAQHLATMGPAAAPAVDELVRLLRTNRNSGDWGPRLTALEALRSIGEGAAPAVPALIEVLGDPNTDLRKRAIQCLVTIGPPGALPAAPPLRKLLADPNLDVRDSARRALSVLGGVVGGSLVMARGDGATVGTAVPTELSVRLTDDDGRPRPNQRVFFQVVSGSATLADSSSITDDDGTARTSLIAGPEPGPISVEGRYESMSVTFRLTGTR